MNELTKPKKYTIEYYDWIEIRDYVDKKYNIDMDDYNKEARLKDEEAPYQNFWHFLLKAHGYEIHNGSQQTINFNDLLDMANEDWQKDIINLFIKEFGEEIEVMFSW